MMMIYINTLTMEALGHMTSHKKTLDICNFETYFCHCDLLMQQTKSL